MDRLRNREALILTGSLLCLGLILWLMAWPLSHLPAPVGPAAAQFADGARTTIALTAVSGVVGLVLGVLAALGKRLEIRAPRRRLLRWAINCLFRCLSDFYVWVIRGTPLLLQILFVYFVLPAIWPGLRLSEFWTAVIALSLNVGAYNAEVIRGGIAAVPGGQIEAARSLGLSSFYTFLDITLPQAVRISLPPLANNLVALLKDSSLAYVIGVVELSMVSSRVQAESFQPIPVFVTSAVLYLALTTTFTQFAGALERKLATGRR